MSANGPTTVTVKIEEGEDSGVYGMNSSCDLSTSFNSSEHRSRVPDEIRLHINSRERQRMHELNDALMALRSVLPQSQGSSLKKLSKLSTLVHAREHILSLSRSVEEMKCLVRSFSRNKVHGVDTLERSSLNSVHYPSAFSPAGQRYSPYTSTPIKSNKLREFRPPVPNGLSPYLRVTDHRLIESEMNLRSKDNASDSANLSNSLCFSLPHDDTTSYQFTSAPSDTDRRNLPEFHTPSKYQNSTSTKPVLKFSVDSLLGLSNKCDGDSPVKSVDIMC
nr:class E basic helix-loop-helix protein 22 [Crassostrea gigas]